MLQAHHHHSANINNFLTMNRLAAQVSLEAQTSLRLSPQAFAHFFEQLNNHNISYIVTSFVAAAFYGYLKSCRGIDVWIAEEEENLDRLQSHLDVYPSDGYLNMNSLGEKFQLRINTDLRFFKSKDFHWCLDKSEMAVISGVTIPVMALSDLITEKTASNHPADLEMAEALERLADDH